MRSRAGPRESELGSPPAGLHISFTGSSLDRNYFRAVRAGKLRRHGRRRTAAATAEAAIPLAGGDQTPVYAGRLEIRPADHAALVDGRPLVLTVRELQLLTELAHNAERVMTREELYRDGLGPLLQEERSLRRRLRRPAAGEARAGRCPGGGSSTPTPASATGSRRRPEREVPRCRRDYGRFTSFFTTAPHERNKLCSAR